MNISEDQLANQQRRIEAPKWSTAIGAVQLAPIKVFTVCIDKDSDKHLAFLGSDPSKKYTAFRTYNAVLGLLIQEKIVSVVELEP